MKGVVKPTPHPRRPLVGNQPTSGAERVNVRYRHSVQIWSVASSVLPSRSFRP